MPKNIRPYQVDNSIVRNDSLNIKNYYLSRINETK